MDYLKLTIEKIENTSSYEGLAAIESAVNNPAFNWSEADRMIINARIRDVRDIWNKFVPRGMWRHINHVKPIYSKGQLIRHRSGSGMFIIESFGFIHQNVMVNCRALKRDGSINQKFAAFRFNQENVKPLF
jgi:hypothetical protein